MKSWTFLGLALGLALLILLPAGLTPGLLPTSFASWPTTSATAT